MSYLPPKDKLPGPELPYLSKELMTKSVNSYVPRVLKMNRIVFKYSKISNYFIFQTNASVRKFMHTKILNSKYFGNKIFRNYGSTCVLSD